MTCIQRIQQCHPHKTRSNALLKRTVLCLKLKLNLKLKDRNCVIVDLCTSEIVQFSVTVHILVVCYRLPTYRFKWIIYCKMRHRSISRVSHDFASSQKYKFRNFSLMRVFQDFSTALRHVFIHALYVVLIMPSARLRSAVMHM
jgi:hypothetical protein